MDAPPPRLTVEPEPFIPYVPDDEVVQNLGTTVAPYMKRMGFLPNALKIYAHRPEIMQRHPGNPPDPHRQYPIRQSRGKWPRAPDGGAPATDDEVSPSVHHRLGQRQQDGRIDRGVAIAECDHVSGRCE